MRATALLLGILFSGTSGADTSSNAKKLRQSTRKLQTDNVIQVDEYECDSKPESFSSSVLVDFHMDVSMLDDDVIGQLEAAFVESYGEAVFALCDVPFFRTVTSAEMGVLANEDENMYREFTNDLFKTTNRTHVLKVDVLASCRECDEDIIFSGIGAESLNSPNLELVLPTVASRQGDGESQAKGEPDPTCTCPSRLSYPPRLRTPTEAEFYALFSTVVEGLDDDALKVPFDLYEVEEVECETQTSHFTSSVFVRFDGDLSTLDDADVELLEESFMATYNGLNFAFCDYPYFRTVTNVTLDRSSLRDPEARHKTRRLQNDTDDGARQDGMEEEEVKKAKVDLDFQENVLLIDPPFDANILKFDIVAECRGCESDLDTPLFSFDSQLGSNDKEDDDATGESLDIGMLMINMTIAEIIEALPISEILLGRSNTLQGDSGSCYCPAHPEPAGRAPTTREFQAAFNITLTTLKRNGMLDEVATLEDVLEVASVECEFIATEFTSTVFVELDMPFEMLSDFERFTVADSFLQSYNALTFSTCDKFFREATEVTLVSASARRRLQDNSTEGSGGERQDTMENATEAPADDRFPAVFNVLGRCRQCQVDDSGSFQLFEDTFDGSTRRKLSQADLSTSIIFGSSVAPAVSGPTRWLQKEVEDSRLQVCTCPADVPPDGSAAPTDEGFIEIFNCRIKELAESGILTGFGMIVDVVEASELCDGGTFFAFMARYKLGFSGDVSTCTDEFLGEAFRVAYNAQRPEDCDPLVATANLIQRTGVPGDDPALSFVRFMVDTLQLEMGDIFAGEGVEERFIAAYNAILESEGCPGVLVSAMIDPSDAPSVSPTEEPTKHPSRSPSREPSREPSRSPSSEPSREPSASPSREPSRSPSQSPSAPPSIAPSNEPSTYPTNNRAMCNHKITELTDSVIIDYSVARVADIELPFNIDFIQEVWPLEEPATLIVAAEYLAAYNRLQQKVFCDPFRRRMVNVTCVSTENKVIFGTVCCTVNFKCLGNCEQFIYPDRDPIGAFYDQPGFEYPTDDSCVCDKENSVDRAPSASEHFDKINNDVPLEILRFEFKGFATDECPDQSTKNHHRQ